MNIDKGEVLSPKLHSEHKLKRITMKTFIEKLYDSGIQEVFETPISSEDDFILHYCVIKNRHPHTAFERKEYLIELKITYKDKVLTDNIVDFERFIASLKMFTDKRSLFKGKDTFFEEKQKDGIGSLQLNIDNKRYIGLMEATQMHFVIFGALQGFSRKLLYHEFRTKASYYTSPEYHKKHGSLMLKNTEVKAFTK